MYSCHPGTLHKAEITLHVLHREKEQELSVKEARSPAPCLYQLGMDLVLVMVGFVMWVIT